MSVELKVYSDIKQMPMYAAPQALLTNDPYSSWNTSADTSTLFDDFDIQLDGNMTFKDILDYQPPAGNRQRLVKRKVAVSTDCGIECSRAETNRLQAPECVKGVSSNTGMHPVLPEGVNQSFSKLDLTTLRMLGWAHGQPQKQQDENTTDGDALNRITKVELKRLSEQVRDVGMNLRNRFRASPYQKLYNRTSINYGGDSVSQGYHNQLTASLQAFQNKRWPPLSREELEPTITRCRPISAKHDRRPSPPGGSTSHRPISLPLTVLRPSTAYSYRRSETPEVTHGNFDTLNPVVLADLIGSNKPRSSFGDTSDYREEEKSHDDGSTSGIESTRSDSDDDESSESELEAELFNNINPMPEIHLRPERLDSIYVPENKKDPRRFDFDAENVDIPPYEFGNPIPEPYHKLDLKLIAKQNYQWRDIIKSKPKEEHIEQLLDRIVEIERIQQETEEWEIKRLKQSRRPRNTSAKSRDRRCCSTCLQPACVGDCPDRFVQTNVCTLCRQPLCEGTCQETSYDDRMRHDREEEIKMYLKPSRKICESCQKKHNAKLINANNLILGRPKSGNATYSRGQSSAKPKDLRPKSVNDLNNEVIKDFEKLGIDASRPSPARSNRPRSRNSLIPSRNYATNRNCSIAELERLRKRKSKAVKLKRPKSVSVVC